MPRKARRRRIPAIIEEETLFRADHTCCICRVRGKDVQIHHIDGNNSNNKPSNLVVLCLDCHSKVTGTRGLGKSYSPGEVRRYRLSWDQQVYASRRIHKPKIRYRKELISQIDLIICEILASKSNSPRLEELLNVLFEIHLYRGNSEIDGKIIEGFNHLALMGGLGSPRLATLMPEKLWEMCFHFVGPEEVPMRRNEQDYVIKCIEALRTLAKFNCEFGHGRCAMSSITEHAENFFDIGLWYSNKVILNAVIRVYGQAIKACFSNGNLEFPYGRKVLRRSLQRLYKQVRGKKEPWSLQIKRLETLMAT